MCGYDQADRGRSRSADFKPGYQCRTSVAQGPNASAAQPSFRCPRPRAGYRRRTASSCGTRTSSRRGRKSRRSRMHEGSSRSTPRTNHTLMPMADHRSAARHIQWSPAIASAGHGIGPWSPLPIFRKNYFDQVGLNRDFPRSFPILRS